MNTEKFPFAVRLLGFAPREADDVADLLLRAPDQGPGYFCLSAHSLQEPDLLIANGDELKALAALAALSSGDLRPALIVGASELDVPYPCVGRPLAADALHVELAQLVGPRRCAGRPDGCGRRAAGGTAPARAARFRFDRSVRIRSAAPQRHARRGAGGGPRRGLERASGASVG